MIAACGTMLNSTASARLFIIIFSMDWSLYWTPMVCHWERYCDWNASIAICGTILISTVTAHLLVSCLLLSAGVLRIIIMVSDSQIELVHAKEIRRCTLLATHVSH